MQPYGPNAYQGPSEVPPGMREEWQAIYNGLRKNLCHEVARPLATKELIRRRDAMGNRSANASKGQPGLFGQEVK